MRISFYTLGCKLNWAETDDLKYSLKEAGFVVVPWGKSSDIAIIRACGVTIDASQTTREIIRSAKRAGAYVVATGCLENSTMPEIDFGERSNEKILKHLLEKFLINKQLPNDNEIIDRTRAFVKIQTGCNFNCAYCIIPYFRGRTSSIPTDAVIKKIKQVEKDGFNEVILTGVNVCLYQDGKNDLAGLLKLILQKTSIPRIRLGSLDPRLISEKLITLYKNPRLLPHMHLSLQSGSDKILRTMCRGYTAKQYLTLTQKLRAQNPLFSFTTDIIVGFPGETENDFNKSCALVKKIGFAKVHVFPYSPRPNTLAATMESIVAPITKTTRVKKLIKISDIAAKKFATQFIGKIRPVLFENARDKIRYGYTPEFVKIKDNSGKNLANKIVAIKIIKSNLA